jgi:hypothetical protein
VQRPRKKRIKKVIYMIKNQKNISTGRKFPAPYICLSAFLLFCSTALVAQKAPHEFSVNAGAGISTYAFTPIPKKASSLGYITDFGFGFTGFISRQVGIHVGVGFGLFNVKSKVDTLYNLKKNLSDFDEHGKELPYELHTKLINYNDMHKSLFINIPIMFHYQSYQKQYWSWKKTQKAGFYARGGVKLLLLLNNQYEATIPTMYNKAYYPTIDNWADTQEFKGLGTFVGNTQKGDLDFGLLATLSLEAGVKWRIENNLFIYTGVYFDCGLNDPIKDNRKLWGDFKDGLDAFNLLNEVSILNYTNSSRANLMVVGIKLHFAFSKKTSQLYSR